MKKPKIRTMIVRVKLNNSDVVSDACLKYYIKTAVESWVGSSHPEYPLFLNIDRVRVYKQRRKK